MPAFEGAGGGAFDVLADPVIRVDGDRAEGRWLLRAGAGGAASPTPRRTPRHFARLRVQGGRQRPGPLTRSIRGWSAPTLEPVAQGEERAAERQVALIRRYPVGGPIG
jgi:hypothetical protein